MLYIADWASTIQLKGWKSNMNVEMGEEKWCVHWLLNNPTRGSSGAEKENKNNAAFWAGT